METPAALHHLTLNKWTSAAHPPFCQHPSATNNRGGGGKEEQNGLSCEIHTHTHARHHAQNDHPYASTQK